MTPEQILIDGLSKLRLTENPFIGLPKKQWRYFADGYNALIYKMTQTYNQAKAIERVSNTETDILTASPLADACEIALSVLQDVDGTSPEYDAIQYAIAQSDELIDHSKKVWDLLRVRRDAHALNCVFYEGEKHCDCGFDEYTEIKESLPDDILVLMEVGDDDY